MRRYSRETAATAIAFTVDPSRSFQLEEMYLHLSAAGGAASLTVTLDAAAGAAFDAVLFTQDMTAVTDLHWQPGRPINFSTGDKLLVEWANGSAVTYGLTVVWSALH